MDYFDWRTKTQTAMKLKEVNEEQKERNPFGEKKRIFMNFVVKTIS